MHAFARLGLLLAAVALLLIGAGTFHWTAFGSADMFGDGSDGAITFSADTQFNPPVDAVVDSGPIAGTTLTVSSTSGGFQPGQKILIHQTRGAGAGQWEMNEVQSYASATITTVSPLANTYTTSGASAAQVLVVPEYTDVTVNAGVTLSAKPWNGSKGGILAFLANGTVTITGTVSANSRGFLGASVRGGQGEGAGGPRDSVSTAANGNGGGGGSNSPGLAGGGGGGNGAAGQNGQPGGNPSRPGGTGGSVAGTADLTILALGGGAGGGGGGEQAFVAYGGPGGGAALLFAQALTVTGNMTSAGGNGSSSQDSAGGAGGAGGSILIKAQTATLGTSLISAGAGAGASGKDGIWGGNGSVGRIRVEYCTSISGETADPPASIAQISCDLEPTATPTPPASVSPLFGDGSDGAITFSFSTQFDPPVDAVVNSGSSGSATMTVSSGSEVFQPGQKILIHQTRGAGAGQWETNQVQSYASGNLTTVSPLANTYTTSGASAAQVLVAPEYTDVTVNAGVTVTAKAWNGSTGGILAFFAAGTVTISGTISASGQGFRGGTANTPGNEQAAYAGESYTGPNVQQTSANGGGGGGAQGRNASSGHGGGGGAGHGAVGADGQAGNTTAGAGGGLYDTAELTIMTLGSGGGGGGSGQNPGDVGGTGGNGGGVVLISGANILSTGAIRADGGNGSSAGQGSDGSGAGGGSGGALFLRVQTATLGSTAMTAVGGIGGAFGGHSTAGNGGAGEIGRIRAEYCTNISGGDADPSASIAQIPCGLSPSVGGVAELPGAAQKPASHSAPFQPFSTAILGATATALLALAAGAWHATRRWLR